MQTLLNILAQGLSLGAIYLLSALGLTVIFGVMRVVNLAHGELLMLGSYVMALTAGTLSVPGAIVAAFVIVAALGVVIEFVLIRHLQHKVVASMLGTWGLALVIRQSVILLFGTQLRYVALPLASSVAIGFGADIQSWRLVLIGSAVLAAVGLSLLIGRTALGLQMRAVIANPGTSEALGLRVSKVNRWAFALGCGLAGLAGALVAPLRTVFPNMGVPYLVGSFLVVVLAGLGNVRATVVWSIVVGIAFAAIAVPVSDTLANIGIWAAALVVITAQRRTTAVARV